MKTLNVGIIGFGLSGRYFHAPLIKAHPGFKITAVSTSRKDEVASVLPQANVAADAQEIINDKNIDLIINCAPNNFHYSYSAAALENGKHVVVEKPFVNTVEEGEKLIQLAEKNKKVLSVFHNRRWDNDFLTVQKLINDQTLGEIKQFESHFDRWRPTVRAERWKEQDQPGSGMFYDLGPHLIDQVLTLFGEPLDISADIAIQKANGQSDDYFHVILKYEKMRVILHSSSFSNTSPRFQIFGDKATFTKYGLDPQEEQLKQGVLPTDSSFGFEKTEQHGRLHNPETNNSVIVASKKGNYTNYYEQLFNFIVHNTGKNPVSATEALRVIKIIELARTRSPW